MSPRTKYTHAFAVVRVDRRDSRPLPELPDLSGPEIELGEYSVTVKEVVLAKDVAEAEVQRLNSINSDKRCHYYWQQTHLFPGGGSFGSEVGTP